MDDGFLIKLPTREFIQGDSLVLAYQFTDTDGDIIQINKNQIIWNLCAYNQFGDIVLTINGTNNPDQVKIDADTGIVYIILTSSNTENLRDGKYIQQPILTYDGNTYIRSWGEVIFRRKVGGI